MALYDDILQRHSTPTPRVTCEERRLIDEAVAAGRVRRIAPGESGATDEWAERRKRGTRNSPAGGRKLPASGFQPAKEQE